MINYEEENCVQESFGRPARRCYQSCDRGCGLARRGGRRILCGHAEADNGFRQRVKRGAYTDGHHYAVRGGLGRHLDRVGYGDVEHAPHDGDASDPVLFGDAADRIHFGMDGG